MPSHPHPEICISFDLGFHSFAVLRGVLVVVCPAGLWICRGGGAADLGVVHRFVVVVCDQPPFGGAVVGGVGAGEREVAWLPPTLPKPNALR